MEEVKKRLEETRQTMQRTVGRAGRQAELRTEERDRGELGLGSPDGSLNWVKGE